MVNICEELRNRKKRKLHIVEILHKLKKLLNEINDDDSPNVTSMAFTINQLSLKSTLLKLKESTYKMFVVVLSEIENEIPLLIQRKGGSFDAFLYFYKVDLGKYENLLKTYFSITKVDVVHNKNEIPELDEVYNIKAKNNEIFFRKVYPGITNTLEENIHGAKVFIPWKNQYIILYGTFNDKHGFGLKSLHEYQDVKKSINYYPDQETKFMNSYLDYSSLREVIINDHNEMITQIHNAYKELISLQKKSFNDIQKMFQNATIVKQRKIMFLLLLSEDKSKEYCIPLLESLTHIDEKISLKNSLGQLGLFLNGIKIDIQKELQQYASSYDDISYQSRIMMMKVDKHVKTKALEKLKEANSGKESGSKAQQYIDGLLKIPFGILKEEPIFSIQTNVDDDMKKTYLDYVRKTLDECVYGHEDAKIHIERLVGQWINGKITGTVFGFQGPPGIGKTTLAKNGFAKCLKDFNDECRPIAFVPLGGSSNGSYLEGHGYTYMGSTWGKIVDILIETQCMNPIIYIDELDKISQSDRGQEIIGILTHLTDSSQNNEFTDKYFSGIKFDLSKAIFIFSYNDPSKIDRILRDRIMEIKTSSLSKIDKFTVTKKFLLKEIYENNGINENDIVFNEECIHYIIDNYTFESGVRKLKERLYDIIRDINLKIIRDGIVFPHTITLEYINEVFSNKPKIITPKVAKKPSIGLVNGLYANMLGLGGITLIEVHKTLGENLELLLTGSQGKVMRESMECAKTVALTKADIIHWKEFKLHIHCPEAATEKDGPSAGIAITTAIISRLLNIHVRHDVAMTGEIDLNGNIHPIGGLEAKLFGALQSNIFEIIIPESNEHDLNLFAKKYKISFNKFKCHLFNHIDQVLEVALTQNKHKHKHT